MDPIDELPISEERERQETTDQEAAAKARTLLSPIAETTLAQACAIAAASGVPAVCSEHLLLALAGNADAASANTLRLAGVSEHILRARYEFVLGRRVPVLASPVVDGVGMSPRVETILASALRDVEKRGVSTISSLYLLSALIRLREGVGIALLEQPGVGTEPVAKAVATALTEGITDPT